jgi:hypothetical protein
MKTFIISFLFIWQLQNCQAINGITILQNPLVTNQRSNGMAIGINGAIYTGLNNGLMKYDNNIWTNYNISNSDLNSNWIYLLNWSISNELLIATDSGITIFNGLTFLNTSFSSLGVPNQINAIEKVQNNLWIGTDQGLYKHDGTNLTTYNVSNNKLNNDTVLELKYWNNEIWVATKNGLTKINNSNNSFTYLSNNSALKQNYIYDIDIFQNKLYIAYKADFNDFLNVQYFNGTIYSQLNDIGMKTKIDRYYHINKINISPEGLILGDFNGEILYFNSSTKMINSSGSNYPESINLAWHTLSNSIAISFLTHNKSVELLDFNSYDCFGCKNLLRNNKYIDINNVRAHMQNKGVMNSKTNYNNNDYLLNPGYEFPKGTNSRIYLQNALWLGGLDNSSNLHLAAQTYQQTGNDFWPGPINIATGTTDTTTAIWYDKIWKINRFEVEEFKWAFIQGSVQNGTYVVPQDIIDWPANGNSIINQNLAPFFDVNGDGLYAPIQDGDYPIIKGDQMLYWIFNDKLSAHTESGGIPLGVEVHASVYAFKCDSLPDSLQVLNNSVFYQFEIINRSNNNYNNFYVGSWHDPDLQLYSDNAVASLPSSNLSYSYSQSQNNIVDSLYNGLKIGSMILNGPLALQNDGLDNNNNGQIDETNEKCLLTNSMNYRNDQSVVGNPQTTNQFYQYMQSTWKDNTPLSYGMSGYGGTTPVKYAFDGQPWDTTTWNCNEAADWRILQSAGPVTFLAGDTITFEYTLVNHQDLTLPWNLQSTFEDYFRDVQTIRNLYHQGNFPTCIALDVATKNYNASSEIKLFPNPAQEYFELNSNGENINQIFIYNLNGSLINEYQIENQHASIDIHLLSPGIYFIQACCKSKGEHFKLIKQ